MLISTFIFTDICYGFGYNVGAFWQAAQAGINITQQAYLKQSDHLSIPSTEEFYIVDIDGDTMAVGARLEDSNATGINGNEADNSATDSGAVYVFTRSGTTWTQQAYIKASNTETLDNFGSALSLNGDTLAVGASGEDSYANGINGSEGDNSVVSSGAVYVFTRSGTAWSQQAYIKASNSGSGDVFGSSLSLSGDTLAVGAPSEDSNASGINGSQGNDFRVRSGAVYVFTRSGTTWTQQAYIKASNPGASDYFGIRVSLSGDSLAVVASLEDSSATGVNGDETSNTKSASGAAYVFTRSGTTWTQQAYLKASNTAINDWFGFSISLSGDSLAVGAVNEDSNATGINGDEANNSAGGSGAVYLFTRSGTTWTQQAYIKASNTGTFDNFGSAVSLSGDSLAVGASVEASNATGINGSEADNSSYESGAVYVFTRSGTTWTQQAYIKASNTAAYDSFGKAVSLDGDSLAVGAFGEDSNATGINGDQSNNFGTNIGAAYVYTRSGTTWSQQAYVKQSDNSNYIGAYEFGYAVSLSGDSLAVGAYKEDSNSTGINSNELDNSASASGAVYVFTRSGTTWTQQAYIKASNTGGNDQFGRSLSLSGDTLVVGAAYEDSNATGINGDEANNTNINSGAVYVFTRSGITWTQQAYIKASNTATNDYFGYAISLSGDSLAVGAYQEDSNATGINGDEANNSAGGSGAVYVFTRTGTTWTQQAYIKASNTAANDNFGKTLSLSGDSLAVGAFGEDSNATGLNGDEANNSAGGSGAVYVFTRTGTTWTQQAYIKASNTTANDFFGGVVSISGDSLAVGAYGEDSNATGVNGDEANNSAGYSGAVYVFTRSGITWTQQAYIKASNTATNDYFGYAISLSGDSLAVGAYQEDSNATGINADEANNSASGSGAVYVFTRSGATWTQQAYIKASNTEGSDYFGATVSISGDSLAVGAFGEDSDTIGINGNQAYNSSSSSGAGYMFTW